MASEDLPIWETEGTWILKGGAHVISGLRVPAPLMVGWKATIAGRIHCDGDVHLGRAARVEGPIEATGMVVVGAEAVVAGPVDADGDVIVQGGAVIAGHVKSGGNVTIRPRSKMGEVRCAGDVHLTGPAETGSLLAGGRTVIGD